MLSVIMKSEIRRPKSERNPKPEFPKSKADRVRISGLGFPSAVGFRTSDFKLIRHRICAHMY